MSILNEFSNVSLVEDDDLRVLEWMRLGWDLISPDFLTTKLNLFSDVHENVFDQFSEGLMATFEPGQSHDDVMSNTPCCNLIILNSSQLMF